MANRGKCRGHCTAMKLHSHQQDQRWPEKQCREAHSDAALKASPVGGDSSTKGIVLRKLSVQPKKPNSVVRKCVRVQLIKNGGKSTAFVPDDGCLNFIEENDDVLIAEFDHKVLAVGDIPGVCSKVVKVASTAAS
ncbi:PREDICTED: 40S ribosomal protein S23-like [Elephantulus edwardii]|uniref:40S ribosomal protein S23-like n=1 Tax=Elephantulus edwardii TaxID=28737 RepID=UPI0003F0E7E4|nr:PREDICTED: 40S ribosomal protein S23-like [Elephantulus edwardii]